MASSHKLQAQFNTLLDQDLIQQRLEKQMDAEKPCPLHENKQITHICLSSECQNPQLFCSLCEKIHTKHHVVSYEQFQKKYNEFEILNSKGAEDIKNVFKKVREMFAICINKAEEMILKQYLPYQSFRKMPKLSEIEMQQIFGLVDEVKKSSKFKQWLTGQIQLKKLQKELHEDINSITTRTDELSANIMTNINKLTSQVNSDKQKKFGADKSIIKAQISNPISSYFKFSDNYKPPIFTVSNNSFTISRNSNVNQGLSMYTVLQQPINKINDAVSFRIQSQKERFIYFGVCDKETFMKFNFKGNLYMMGNKMYAIRQSGNPGKNGICLHNSVDIYSNKDKVPFDFGVGDIITIRFIESKNSIIFIKNAKQKFQMPLDKAISHFYPFVGLKYNGDSVRIVDHPVQNKIGSFLSLFQSSIK